MKLLYVTNGINGAGGLERVLSVKASYLAEHYNYDVTILVLNDAHLNPFYEFSKKIKMVSIDVSGSAIKYILSYKNGIQKVINQFQPDVISVCDNGLKAFLLPHIINTNSIIICERHASINRNTDNSLKGRMKKNIMQRLSSFYDRFIVLTTGNAKEWPNAKVEIIPNPLSFYSKESAKLDNKSIIVVGTHSFDKGYDMLLNVWKIIEEKYPLWKLNIYGKIDSNKTFVKQSKHLKLKNVFFHLPYKDIKNKYIESSVLILPSRNEGFGMVLIEAMECGVPCISFNCPAGPADIIKNNHDGLLVKNGSLLDLENKISLLIENDELRKEMGSLAKENVKRYNVDMVCKQWDLLFKKLINENNI